jgi:hypothetical protein
MMTKQSDGQGYLLCPFVAMSSAKEIVSPDPRDHLGSINWQAEAEGNRFTASISTT